MKVTLQNYKKDKYYPKIVIAVKKELDIKKYVSPIDVFKNMDLLDIEHVENWKNGRTPYLEKVIKCNLNKASRILGILRYHAHDLNLKPSLTSYTRKTKSRKFKLQFSKSGESRIEESYSRHFVLNKSERKEKW